MLERLKYDETRTIQWLADNGFGPSVGDAQEDEILGDKMVRLAKVPRFLALAMSVEPDKMVAETHRLVALCRGLGMPDEAFDVRGAYYPTENIAVIYLSGVDDTRMVKC